MHFIGTLLSYVYRSDSVVAPVLRTQDIENFDYLRTHPDLSLNIGTLRSQPRDAFHVHPGDNRALRPFISAPVPSMKIIRHSEN